MKRLRHAGILILNLTSSSDWSLCCHWLQSVVSDFQKSCRSRGTKDQVLMLQNYGETLRKTLDSVNRLGGVTWLQKYIASQKNIGVLLLIWFDVTVNPESTKGFSRWKVETWQDLETGLNICAASHQGLLTPPDTWFRTPFRDLLMLQLVLTVFIWEKVAYYKYNEVNIFVVCDFFSNKDCLNQLEHKQVPKRGTEPGVRKGKRSLLTSRTRSKCSMEIIRNSVKIKLGIKVMKLVESHLIRCHGIYF